ncbi:MAG: hypothetical protein V1733_11745 [bacterium]
MSLWLKKLLLLILSGIIPPLYGQYFSTGQDPPSMHWRQIKSDSFRIIFPRSFETHAQYLANILELTTRHETQSLETKVPRMPFLLHTQSTVSNGITVWAPRRIELYPCPPQGSYAEEWLEQLALHEYRHAVQVSKMNRGFTKALYVLFGEQAPGAILGLYLPRWFLEGDATVMETALSNAGRGRLPSFAAPLRALLLQKGIYSYDLATLGSYKTFTPDAYTLGYHLVAKGRERYGPQLWDCTLDKVAKLPFMVVPFNAGIRKETGMWKTRFYRTVMEELLVEWQQIEDSTFQSLSRLLTKPNRNDYTLYGHPVFFNDSIILTARRSNEDVQRLILLDRDGNEQRLIRLGAYQDESHSFACNTVVWAEDRPDIRWENRSYSVIRKLEIRKKEIGKLRVRDLTRRSRYFSPALSPDGSQVLAVRITEENRCFIDILGVSSGSLITTIPAPDNGLFLQPYWSPDGRKITFALLTEKGKTIGVTEPVSQTFTFYLPWSFTEVNGPSFFFEQYLVYTAAYSGIDNLYAVDTLTRQIYQVTSARFQATDPDFSSDHLRMVYSDYCADGMMVAEKTLDPATWLPLEEIKDRSIPLASYMAEQEQANIQDSSLTRKLYKLINGSTDLLKDSIRGNIFPVTRYPAIRHLFNIHSWAPASVDATNMTVHPGVSVLSQNLLSTAFATAGYDWNLNERTGKCYLNFSYQGWFPVIDLHYSYGKRAGFAQISQTGETFRFTWNESTLQATVSVPLNLSRGLWYRGIQPLVGTSWIQVLHDKTTPGQFTTGSVSTLDYRLYAYNYIISNYQDMFPQWGQNLDITFRFSPFRTNNIGSILGVETNLYFPGILRHQGIWLYAGYQQRWDQLVYGYEFANLVSYPAGIQSTFDQHLISLAANYKFPFLRIDASVGSLLYIKRFRLNLFYDWATGWGTDYIHTYQSTGAELTADLHILRFLAPFELGVSAAYLPQTQTISWRFLWGISL